MLGKKVTPALVKLQDNFIKTGGIYGEYQLQELFDIVGTKSLDEGKLIFVNDGVNFVGRVNDNNGVKGKIDKQLFKPNEPFTITATVIGNYKYVKYQQEPYYCSQNINKLIPNFNINEKIALYFITFIQKFVNKYNGQQGGYKLYELQEFKIKVPYKNNKIDFEFIENYISELEKERISELTAYLKVSGLDNTQLSSSEECSLHKMNDGISTANFKIGDLFEINSSKKKFNANSIKFGGKYPYVARGSSNNGIRGFITEAEEFLNDEKTISFGQDTATIFYQEKAYFTGDKIKILTYKYGELNQELACYFIASMKKNFDKFSWGQNSFNETIIKDVSIKLPINSNNEIDFEFMENYIKAIEKLTIKSVIEWKDKIIEVTKKCIDS